MSESGAHAHYQPSKWGQIRKDYFGDPANSTITVLVSALLVWLAYSVIPWASWNAVWAPDHLLCREAAGTGACWGSVAAKWELIIFGRYPRDELWRPVIASILFIGAPIVACYRPIWRWEVFVGCVVAIILAMFLLIGGAFGLTYTETDLIGGLPLTLVLALVGNTLALPLGILLAMGRAGNLPVARSVCTTVIEVIRGVPLITVLFMASFLFPLFLPSGTNPNVLLRILAGITLFSAAYQAEVVRGGLNSIPRGQLEAAAALGMGYWLTQIKIVLPQALRVVVPPLMNSFIAVFKDTSLVVIVSMFELLGSMKMAYADPLWRRFHAEGYIFVAILFFIFCFSMSRYSKWLEKQFQASSR